MPKFNNPEEMKLIYEISKKVYSGDYTAAAASRLLENKTSASKASVKMYFTIYAAMKKGVCYKMGTGADFTQFLIESIYEDDGKEALILALTAAKLNSEYRIACGNEQPGIEAVCREIIAKYELETKYEDLPTYHNMPQIKGNEKNVSSKKQKQIESVDYEQLPNNMLRLKITIGEIIFEVEGNPQTVIKQEKRFLSETLPIALEVLNSSSKKQGQLNKSSKNSKKTSKSGHSLSQSRSRKNEKVECVGKTLIKKHPYLKRLNEKMDFKARMIPLMYFAQVDNLQEDFSINEIKKIMFDALEEMAGEKQIDDVFTRRSDWFEKTNSNPKKYKLLDIGFDYARNILNDLSNF